MLNEIQRHAGKLYAKYSGEVVKNDIDPNNTGIIMVTVPSVFGAGVSVASTHCCRHWKAAAHAYRQRPPAKLRRAPCPS